MIEEKSYEQELVERGIAAMKLDGADEATQHLDGLREAFRALEPDADETRLVKVVGCAVGLGAMESSTVAEHVLSRALGIS